MSGFVLSLLECSYRTVHRETLSYHAMKTFQMAELSVTWTSSSRHHAAWSRTQLLLAPSGWHCRIFYWRQPEHEAIYWHLVPRFKMIGIFASTSLTGYMPPFVYKTCLLYCKNLWDTSQFYVTINKIRKSDKLCCVTSRNPLPEDPQIRTPPESNVVGGKTYSLVYSIII